MDCKGVSVFEMWLSSHPTQGIFSHESETKQRLPSCNVLCSHLQDGGSLACLPPLVFPVVMYGCESWTIKKAECRRIDASELWCWRRLLRVPWSARRSNQSILKEISFEYSLEGLMLKLQHFVHLMRRVNSVEKTLMPGKTGQEQKGVTEDEMDGSHHQINQWTWVWVNSGSWWWTGRACVLWFMGSQRVGHDWANELNWPLVSSVTAEGQMNTHKHAESTLCLRL